MKRKSVLNVLALAVLVSALVGVFFLYFELNDRLAGLESDYNYLLNEHELLQTSNDELESDFQSLNDSYVDFANDYDQLNESYQTLATDYVELTQSYDELYANYTPVFSNYSALLEVVENPLSHEDVPSVDELNQWLAVDKTDEIEFEEPDFLCGDFTTMLSLHAKMNNWDMGVITIYGRTTDGEDFAHAINAIICEEGLVYIEPQTDEVWWLRDHRDIPENAWSSFPGFGRVYVEQYSVVVWFS